MTCIAGSSRRALKQSAISACPNGGVESDISPGLRMAHERSQLLIRFVLVQANKQCDEGNGCRTSRNYKKHVYGKKTCQIQWMIGEGYQRVVVRLASAPEAGPVLPGRVPAEQVTSPMYP